MKSPFMYWVATLRNQFGWVGNCIGWQRGEYREKCRYLQIMQFNSCSSADLVLWLVFDIAVLKGDGMCIFRFLMD